MVLSGRGKVPRLPFTLPWRLHRLEIDGTQLGVFRVSSLGQPGQPHIAAPINISSCMWIAPAGPSRCRDVRATVTLGSGNAPDTGGNSVAHCWHTTVSAPKHLLVPQ